MSWELVEMQTFLNERKGRFKPDDSSISGLKRIEKIDFSGEIYLSNKPSKTDMILIKNGDLVISGINVEKGAMSIYLGEEDVTATIHYSSYIYNPEKIDIEFLRHFLKSSEFTDALKEQVPGGIKTEIKPKHILPLKVYIPTSLDEQRSVVLFLDSQNDRIKKQSAELTHQLDLVKQLRQAFLREAMQGKLVPQDPNDEPASELLKKIKSEKEKLLKEGKLKKQKPLPPITKEEIPFEIPKNWVWCRLGSACIKITDGTHHSPINTPLGDYMYVTAKNIKDEGVDLSNISFINKDVHNQIFSRCDPEYGDVLYIKDGATTGVVTINNISEPFSLLSSVALLKLDDNIYNRFLMYTMRSPAYYNTTRNNMYGVALTRVTLSKINDSLISLPPLTEQKRIVAKLDEIMQYCDELEESIKQSQTQNEQLLQQVLREALEPKEKEVEKA